MASPIRIPLATFARHTDVDRASSLLAKRVVTSGGRPNYAPDTSFALCTSDGTQTSALSRFKITGTADGRDLQVVFGNYAYDQPGANDITIRASIEYAGGVETVPLFFGGQRYAVVRPGASITSDPSGVSITDGTYAFIRVEVQVESLGMKWPLNNHLFSGQSEGVASPSPGTVDSTGTVAHTGADGSKGYGPAAVIGACAADVPVVAIWGDSIDVGIGDSTGQTHGWAERLLNLEAGYVNLSRHSGRLTHLTDQPSVERQYKLPYLQGATHLLSGRGTNDTAAGTLAAATQDDLMEVWTWADERGLVVAQRTYVPRTTSTDSWATTGNQTPIASEAVRVALNAYIRSRPVLPSGRRIMCIETADTCETARDSGIWRVGYTTDGIHPNATGSAAMAAATPLSALLAYTGD